MKKILFGFLLILISSVVQATTEFLTIRVRGMELYINHSNGTTEIIKLKKEDFGDKAEAELPALAKMQELSSQGWMFTNVVMIDNGLRCLYFMKKDNA